MTLNRITPPTIADNFSFPEIEPQKYLLENNLPLFVIDSGSQDLCKVELIFDAGNYFEQEPLIATAVNSLLREGTTTRSAQQIAEQLDFYGAFLETSIRKDKASVILYSLNKHLHQTIPVMMEVVQQAIFPEKEVTLYKTNQRQKFLINQQKVDFIARNQFNHLLFQGSRYGKLIEISDFDGLTREKLQAFFAERYAGHATYMVLSGKITPQVLNLLQECAAQMPQSPERVSHSYNCNMMGRQEQFYEKPDALQSAIRIGRRLFNKTHPDYFGMKVLNTVLGGYFGSRLMSNIREDKGYTYGIGSGVSSMLYDGAFYISTEVGVDVTQPTLIEIYKELELLQQELISQQELTLVKNYLLGAFLRSVDGPFAISEKFTAIYEYGLANKYYKDYVNYLKQVKSEELRQLAQKYWNKNDLSQLVVGKI